jgi:hypothetical protein
VPDAPLALVGRTTPKERPAIFSLPPATDGSLTGITASPHPLDVGEAQRVQWQPNGAAAAIVAAVPGDFASSSVYMVDSAFSAVSTPVSAAFDSCVAFTPDSRWLLYISPDGGSLLAVPADNLGAAPIPVLTGEPRLDLCETAWQHVQDTAAPPPDDPAAPVAVDPGELTIGAVVTGTIDDAQYEVTYDLPLTAGQAITVTMERISDDLDSYLLLFDPEGREVARNDDAAEQIGDTSTNAQIQDFTAPLDGTYTVTATRFFQETGLSNGTFRLSVTAGDASPIPAATEIPAVPAAANALTRGATVTGTIDNATYEQAYTVELTAGEAVTFTMIRLDGDLDPLLVLFGPDGSEADRNDDALETVGELALNSQIAGFTPPVSGTYTLVATRYAQAEGLSGGTYQISMTGDQPVAPPPDTTPPAASTTLSVGSVASGTINDTQFVADYTIALDAGQTITVTLERTGDNLDPLLYIFGPNGAELAVNDDAETPVSDLALNSQIVDFTAPESGTYTIRATRYAEAGGLSTGTFQLSVTGAGETAAPPPVVNGGLVPDPGQVLTVGGAAVGVISVGSPAVNYALDLTAGDTITVTMLQQGGDLDPLLILYDPAGAEVARNDDALAPVGSTSLNAQIAGYTAATSGTYIVRATRYDQEAGLSIGMYEIIVTEGAPGMAEAANPSGTLALGGSVTGTVSDSQPVIVYELALEAGQTVTITMLRTGGDLDPLLFLYSPDQQQAASNDDASPTVGDSSLNAQIAGFVAPVSGTYLVEATRFARETGLTSGAFTLSASTDGGGTAPVPAASGTALQVGATATGMISSEQPAVDYTITLNAGQTITVTLERVTDTLDAYLQILDEQGRELAYNDDAATTVGDSSLNAQITGFSAPASGTYIIRATRYNQEVGDSSGEYRLTVSESTGGGAGDVQDGIRFADPVAVGDTVTNEIAGDVYAVEYPIQLAEGETIAVTMIALNGSLDPLLAIYEPGGQPDAYNDDAASIVGDSSFNAQIASYTAAEAGTYFIWATRYNLEDGDSEGGFEMAITTADPVIAAEGGPITPGSTDTNGISTSTFAVDYTITLRAGETITVTMIALDDTLDPSLVILDEFGNEMAYNDDAEVQVGESSYNAQIVGFAPQTDGTYTIRATRFFEEGGSSLGRFELTVSAGIPEDTDGGTK